MPLAAGAEAAGGAAACRATATGAASVLGGGGGGAVAAALLPPTGGPPRSMPRLPFLDGVVEEGVFSLGLDQAAAWLAGERVGVASVRSPGVPSCRKRHRLAREHPPGLLKNSHFNVAIVGTSVAVALCGLRLRKCGCTHTQCSGHKQRLQHHAHRPRQCDEHVRSHAVSQSVYPVVSFMESECLQKGG